MNKLFKLLFWISNATLLVVLCVGFLPSIGMALARDSIGGRVPIDLMMPFVGLIGVPITAVITGRKRQQAKVPLSLFELFYALEAPIFAACAIRLFMLRDLTPASGFLLVSGLLGFAGSRYWFWQQRVDAVEQRGNLASLVGLSLFLGVSLYSAAIASFFVLPVAVWLIAHIYVLLFSIIVLQLFTCGVALSSLPFGMVFIAQKLWWQNLQQSIDRYGKWQVQALLCGLAIVWLGVFISIQHQPQAEAFALLNKQPVDRIANLQKSAQIQQGLLNAYLSKYRYLRQLDDKSVLDAYKCLGVPGSLAQGIQNAYNLLTEPFTYQGNPSDREAAANLYAQFFDTPILRGEKDPIRHAIESNFNRSEVNAGLLSIDAKRVLLAQQQRPKSRPTEIGRM